MKKFFLAIVAAVTLSTFPATEAKAQFPYYRGGFSGYSGGYSSGYSGGYGFQPYSYGNAFYNSQAFNNAGFYVNPRGFGFYQNAGALQRSYYSGGGYSPYGYGYAPAYRYGGASGGYSTQRYYFGW